MDGAGSGGMGVCGTRACSGTRGTTRGAAQGGAGGGDAVDGGGKGRPEEIAGDVGRAASASDERRWSPRRGGERRGRSKVRDARKRQQ